MKERVACGDGMETKARRASMRKKVACGDGNGVRSEVGVDRPPRLQNSAKITRYSRRGGVRRFTWLVTELFWWRL